MRTESYLKARIDTLEVCQGNTVHTTKHTHKKNLGQNRSFPQKTANIWKLGTVERETKICKHAQGK